MATFQTSSFQLADHVGDPTNGPNTISYLQMNGGDGSLNQGDVAILDDTETMNSFNKNLIRLLPVKGTSSLLVE